jgi:hypothetical protein
LYNKWFILQNWNARRCWETKTWPTTSWTKALIVCFGIRRVGSTHLIVKSKYMKLFRGCDVYYIILYYIILHTSHRLTSPESFLFRYMYVCPIILVSQVSFLSFIRSFFHLFVRSFVRFSFILSFFLAFFFFLSFFLWSWKLEVSGESI